MTPYVVFGSRIGTLEASALVARLSAWHDAMVAHERRLRTGAGRSGCDEECPHAEAEAIWTTALEVFGQCAHELTFLRTRAQSSGGDARSRG